MEHYRVCVSLVHIHKEQGKADVLLETALSGFAEEKRAEILFNLLCQIGEAVRSQMVDKLI